ncbi:MAG: HAD hydrolase-like protein, partial [Promethearchaeota archaeon]
MTEISFNEKKIIVFDLDGTVVRLDVAWTSLKEHLTEIYSNLYEEKCDFKSVSACLRKIVEREDEKVLKDFFDIIRQYELKNIKNTKPIEETTYFIKNLELFGVNNRVKLAILSLNTRKTINKSLRLTNLSEFFDLVVGREDLRSWKPDP